MNVIEHGPGSVRVIRHVNLSGSQFPDQPCIDGTKQKLAFDGPLPGTLHMIQNPFQLRRGKVRIRNQAGFLTDIVSESICRKRLDHVGCAAALPHNRVVHGLSRHPVPDNGRLSLIRDPDSCNTLRTCPQLSHRLRCHTDLR